jgi:transcriptional regulator with XRE-family HTH domain
VEYEQLLAMRLAELRKKRGVSARDMSLSMGQNVNYVNRIEHGRMMPSMQGFFAVCEYLNITPKDFFDFDSGQPERVNGLVENLKKLDDDALGHVAGIVGKML